MKDGKTLRIIDVSVGSFGHYMLHWHTEHAELDDTAEQVLRGLEVENGDRLAVSSVYRKGFLPVAITIDLDEYGYVDGLVWLCPEQMEAFRIEPRDRTLWVKKI